MKRTLNPAIKAHFDAVLGPEVIGLSPVELLLKAAPLLIGVTESNSPLIVHEIRSAIVEPWNQPWCADFIQTLVAYVEGVKGIQSPLAPSESVLTMWNDSPDHVEVQDDNQVRPGDIIVWQLGNTAEGHCGIITAIDSLLYETVEGNTSDSAEIDRMGRGVFAKKRAKGGTKTFKEVGFLRVFA